MAKILSTAQKKTIYDAIPTNYTIETIVFNPSKIYTNQLANNQNYPLIVLNYPQQGNVELEDITEGVAYYKSVLTIHILATNHKGTPQINGARIAEGIASGILTIIAAWKTPLTGDIRIFSNDDILPVGNVSDPTEGVYDYIISVNLSHS